jgi:hypothetical protein
VSPSLREARRAATGEGETEHEHDEALRVMRGLGGLLNGARPPQSSSRCYSRRGTPTPGSRQRQRSLAQLADFQQYVVDGQVATGRPAMAIGGFNGAHPLLHRRKRPGGGGMAANGGSNASQEIAAWIAENFSSRTMDGVTIYDLTA